MRWLKLFLLVLLPFNLFGQSQAPVLLHKSKGDYKPLRIDSLYASVNIIGNVAHTELTFVFYNDLNRVLEGQLYFPLNEGQAISHFAMDIQGEMRDAVVVEREKGRKVFEEIVRKGIDPGLLEYVKGNNFKARVYPIPKKGYKRITIGYDEGLDKSKDGYLYRLPLSIRQVVKQFTLKVNTQELESEPVVKSSAFDGMIFSKQEKGFYGEWIKSAVMPNREFKLLIPHANQLYTYVGEGEIKKQDYFYIHFQPEGIARKKNLPKQVCLIWDQSNSAEHRDTKKELELLDAYFKQLKDVKLRLVTFNNEVRVNRSFEVSEGNWEEAKSFLSALVFDGGTQLGVLDLSSYDCQEFLLFTDGMSNIGESTVKLLDANKRKVKARVNTINTNTSAEHSYLNYLAEVTGGHYLNLNKLNTTQAVSLLTSEPFRFISASYKAEEISETYPNQPVTVQGNFALSGILKAKEAVITLNFGYDAEIVERREVLLKKSEFGSTSQVELIWANQKLQELDRQYDQHQNEITSLGKEFGVVTRNTSLIVLDDPYDYLRYQIKPPTDVWQILCKKLKWDENKEWTQLVKRVENRGVKEYLVNQFKKRQNWYYTHFITSAKAQEITKSVVKERDYFSEEELEEDMEGEYFDMGFDDFGSDDFGEEEEAVVEEDSGDKKSISKKKEKGKASKITMAPWSSNSPYVKLLEPIAEQELYSSYLELKKEHGNKPGFYVDVANFFLHKGDTNTAILIASNLAELELENHEVMRLLASLFKLANRFDLAVKLHEEVLELRRDEIQSYRDLALAYEGNKEYQKALDVFYESLIIDWKARKDVDFGTNDFDDPFGFGIDEEVDWLDMLPNSAIIGVQEVVLGEMNRLIALQKDKLDISGIDSQLILNMPVEMRVVVDWDSDNFDMDLWVTNPTGEKCYYGNRSTLEGGYYTYDNTSGYGPEEFLLKTTSVGDYKVQMNYYGARSQKILAPVTVTVKLFTDYGTTEEKMEQIILRLGDKKEVVDAGSISFEFIDKTIAEERYEEMVFDGMPFKMKMSSDEKYLAVVVLPMDMNRVGNGSKLQVYDFQTKKLLFENNSLDEDVIDLAFSDTGNKLTLLRRKFVTNGHFPADEDEDGFVEDDSYDLFRVQLFDVLAGKQSQEFMLEHPDFEKEGWNGNYMYLIDANTILTALQKNQENDKEAKIENALFNISSNGIQIKAIESLNNKAVGLAHSKSYIYVFYTGSDSILVFDKTGKYLKLLEAPEKLAGISRANDESDQIVLSFDLDKNSSIRNQEGIWDLKDLEKLDKLTLANMQYSAYDRYTSNRYVCYTKHPSRDLVLLGDTEVTSKSFPADVKLVETSSKATLLHYFHQNYVQNAQFSPKGTYIISLSQDKSLRYRKLNNIAAGGYSPQLNDELVYLDTELKEYAYYVYGKTMVVFEKQPEMPLPKIFQKMDSLTFLNKESKYPEIAQFIVFTEELSLDVIGNTTFNPAYAEAITTNNDYELHDWVFDLQMTSSGNRLFVKINDASAMIDIDVLNELAEGYEHTKGSASKLYHLMKKMEKQMPEGRYNLNLEGGTTPMKKMPIYEIAFTFFPIGDESTYQEGILDTQNRYYANVLNDRIEVYNLDDFELVNTGITPTEDQKINFEGNSSWIKVSGEQTPTKREDRKLLDKKDTLRLWNWNQNVFVTAALYYDYKIDEENNFLVVRTPLDEGLQNDALLIYNQEGELLDSLITKDSYHYSLTSGEHLLIYQSGHTVYFYDLMQQEVIYEQYYEREYGKWFQSASPYAFTADNKSLFLLKNRTLAKLNWETKQVEKSWDFGIGSINGIAFDESQNRLATIHDDQSMRIWQVKQSKLELIKTYFGGNFKGLSFKDNFFVTLHEYQGDYDLHYEEELYWNP